MNAHLALLKATLAGLAIGFSSLAQAAVCDVDQDGDVDRQDIRSIVGARNTPASGPADPRDADADGTITVTDARICIRQCDLPNCTIKDPAPPRQTGDAGESGKPATTRVQEAVKDIAKPAVSTSDKSSADIQGRTGLAGREWKVKRGDTLYAIGRAVYPGDAQKQARLRQDIIRLNPAVFANGANNMAVGVVLKLPDYAVSRTAPEVKPEPETPGEPAPVPKISEQPEPESPAAEGPPVVKKPSASFPFGGEGNTLISLGHSYGGDKLEFTDGSYDPAGSGGQLRVGYEQMYPHGGGYRVALGLQYGLAKDSDGTTSLRDTYLQLAYQYRATPFIYGVGVGLYNGATLSGDSTIEYDAANGLLVYLENVGSTSWAGWGLSYTSLEIEEKDTSESFDASRIEAYYSWRF